MRITRNTIVLGVGVAIGGAGVIFLGWIGLVLVLSGFLVGVAALSGVVAEAGARYGVVNLCQGRPTYVRATRQRAGYGPRWDC